MREKKIIGAVDIGTSKVIVLIAEIVPGQSMTLIGKGETTMQGMRRGEVIQIGQVSNAAHAAILAAEKQADAEIEQVYMSLSGTHLQGFVHNGVTTITSNSGIVTESDRIRAMDNARSKVLAPGMVYLHHVKRGYALDGKPVEDPVGHEGRQLQAHYWHVAGDETLIKQHLRVVNGIGLDVAEIVISSIASGSLLATEMEKRQGVMVVDIGKGTTDVVVYKGGRIVYSSVIPVGGEHVTNDLSIGLRTQPQIAEKLKLRAAHAMLAKNDREQKVRLVGDLSIGDSVISQLTVNKITHARLEELFMILKDSLGNEISRQYLPCGMILTGGVALTPQIDELAEVTLDIPVIVGRAPQWVCNGELQHPGYSTVLGLLHNALHRTEDAQERQTPRRKSFFDTLTGIFK